jgi:hypothetical protein
MTQIIRIYVGLQLATRLMLAAPGQRSREGQPGASTAGFQAPSQAGQASKSGPLAHLSRCRRSSGVAGSLPLRARLEKGPRACAPFARSDPGRFVSLRPGRPQATSLRRSRGAAVSGLTGLDGLLARWRPSIRSHALGIQRQRPARRQWRARDRLESDRVGDPISANAESAARTVTSPVQRWAAVRRASNPRERARPRSPRIRLRSGERERRRRRWGPGREIEGVRAFRAGA